MNDEWEDATEAPSRSSRKREAEALQRLGEAVLALPSDQRRSLPLSEALLDACALADRLTANGARRRQKQLIGKLMREVDPEPIQEALNALKGVSARSAAHHRRIEHWRDRLLAEGDEAVTAFMSDYPDVDQQHLRQLLRNARRESQAGKPPRAARELFRLVREAMPDATD
ncbi:ribosome-associated protein [Natronocella acetinitrilica]|uniref:Dual-action ribosomal maturation protein DarP n=1 Tax=Natronocella acetinitrilica TaxID=414046 RepID=A0AAE3KGH5_9GAMM|nr:ribosome biogenesis factor YjgA [Natronocella acetinitrilica]MCP1675247.1 ribosome-associated protein [Natronocella acetinitrilica]